MAQTGNVCAGPFGAAYDFYIERERLSRVVGRLIWGIDSRPLYRSLDAIREVPDGATILDVPCGGGVALRALDPGREVRYIAGDIADGMLMRVRRRVAERGLSQVEVVRADMRDLPFGDAIADLALSFSGLHCVEDPEAAVRETVRCLEPGGRLVGTTFLARGTRRQRFLFEQGRRRGDPMPEFGAEELRGWLEVAGIEDATVDGDRGFVAFHGRKAAG